MSITKRVIKLLKKGGKPIKHLTRDYLDWIKRAMEEDWGVKCPEFKKGCPCCEVWKKYEFIETNLKFMDRSGMEFHSG